MSANYFWKGGEVIQFDFPIHTYEATKEDVNNLWCVDTFTDNPTMRYGKFLKTKGWMPYPLASFPKEFRAWLLINT